jgi:2-keto-4-pentenoate hydratase
MLTQDDIDWAAADLAGAAHTAKPIPPLTDRWPRMDLADAYAIQLRGVQAAIRNGQQVIGYKIGLTTPAVQRQLGVLEPDFGHLLDDMQIPDSGTVALSDLCSPRAEPEIAFVLSDSIATPGATAAEVLRATEALRPAVEIVDSRVADWRITIADTVADNASSGRFALGSSFAVEDVDLGDVAVTLAVDGSVVYSGSSAAVMDGPATAVAWLANTLAAHGVRMSAGDVILSGSCTPTVGVHPGETVTARFVARGATVGTVSVRFIGTADGSTSRLRGGT